MKENKLSNAAITEIFSERFKELRNVYGMSIDDVAKRLKISRQSVVYYSMGDRLPRIPILIAIAKLFNTSMDYLLGLRSGDTLSLQCTVGSTVYLIGSVKSGRKFEQTVISGQIDHFTIDGLGVPLADICTDDNRWYYACAYPNDYFLTQEEAQETLKKNGGTGK